MRNQIVVFKADLIGSIWMQNLQSEVFLEWIKVTVSMEQFQVVFDTECGD